jgi:predicted dinucleotide-utilizing enzyme
VKYRVCGRILAVVLLMSFWKTPVYGEPPTTQTRNSEESGMRQYSESEVDTLIEDLTAAAHEAIEQAAAEAVRATALASLDREMSLLQAKALAMAEAQRLQSENSSLKKSRVKTAIVTGVVCFFGGLAVGAGGIAIVRSF